MPGIDAHPYVLFATQGGPQYVAPARDRSDATFDTEVALEGAAAPVAASEHRPGIEGLGTIDLAFAYQVTHHLRLDAEVPFHGAWGDGGSWAGFGDARLGATVALVADEHRALSAAPMCFVPTGDAKLDLGTGRFGCGGVVAASLRAAGFEATLNVGARVGGSVPVGDLRAGTGPIGGASITKGADRGFTGSLFVVAHGTTGFRDVPVLAGASARIPTDEDYLAVSIAHGLGSTPGTPGLVVSLSFVPSPSPPPVPRAYEGRAIGATVTFESDGDFPPEAISTLEALCALMRENPEIAQLLIEGHSSTMPYALEWETSRGRALRVARWLAENGVEPERLAIRGRGSLEPQWSDLKDPRNNRVEFVITDIAGARRSVPVRTP